MKNTDAVRKIEQAQVTIQQLLALMNLYMGQYMDVPVETFVKYSRMNKESIETLAQLEYDILLDIQNLIREGVEGIYKENRENVVL